MKRFVRPDEIKVGRTYHLKQIKTKSPYLLLEIIDEKKVRIKRLDGDCRERIVNKTKLLSTYRHDPRK